MACAQLADPAMAALAAAEVPGLNTRRTEMTSAIIGASRVSQLDDAVGALNHLNFEPAELEAIDQILG